MKLHYNLINSEKFVQELKNLNCGKSPFLQVSANDFELRANDIIPPKGIKLPEKYPYCCGFHEEVLLSAKKLYFNFPNCCEHHKRLNTTYWFKKENYNYLPDKLLNQITYTVEQISFNINKPEWYQEITDYIEYNFYSFGQLPLGYGSPVGLSQYLETIIDIVLKNPDLVPKEKGIQLAEFIKSYYNPTKKSESDFNILIKTYQKWLKAFPFEISFFKGLKVHFEKNIPISGSKPAHNKYLNISKVKLFTKAELVEVLIDKTYELINQVDAVKLVEKDIISDIDKQALELINEAYQFEIKTLSEKYSKKEMKYITVLRNWRQLGKDYFKEIAPYYKKVPQQTTFKPVFSPEAIPILYDILKEHFPKKQQFELKRILETGEAVKEILFFRDNGNRLADAFKQLYDAGFITGCDKSELEAWIARNFSYRHHKTKKDFTLRYLNDIISTTKDKCQRPLINVVFNKVAGRYQIERI